MLMHQWIGVEECDIGKRIMYSSSGIENLRGPSYMPLKRFVVQQKKHSNWEKEVRTGKMRYLLVEEALSLSSSTKRYGSPLINIVFSRVVSTKSMETLTRWIFSKSRAQTTNSFCPGGSTSLEHRSPDTVNESNVEFIYNTPLRSYSSSLLE
ncbi:hypothetical protein H5410_060573, partial [Solanum commersonii]